MKDDTYQILYEFRFDDGKNKIFKIFLDPETILIIRPDAKNKPDWARLEYKKCKCCTLNEKDNPFCPIAVNISELTHEFSHSPSFDKCIVRCTTPERTYVKKASIQEGLFSIFGIIMATSNCPVMNFFRPMARFHLPFATIQETVFRSTSIYLLGQYFEYKRGKIPDLDLKNLDKHYEKVQAVNEGILKRTYIATHKDADKNAIIILNALAQMLTMEIGDSLNSLEYLFID
jgi:hypothetical protein